ncbi:MULTISPECIES: acyl-CoA thioesterase [unclassified Arthrobacter]|uniref:acyl-CoA thioesterase n=1 Tax=unclassified Arthrobacter TaxID=235627 RepID=UPI001D14EBFC|nr:MULTISPECIES: thioesterase family protein [unclassified Arthrobacter]MCC3275024.1 acyl-CoA thioesterase [Arthrobacter sp. zg-Y20]MCC3279004.1 acyl-CoA thioesterase [Arthrobacter sp. zg-Y40]MCC9177379.1 acyl-CoA thioesterase [Arthrobacter sp. zg-Y750]MDK1315181.1 thioesterase family protein [Arthrobacter sp. zg.Y20]MDK1328042.1 thioesterase family protein [Arthrobacter sp. zg-Y1143]
MHRFPVHLRFGDQDPNGHINNVRFVQFLEEARVRLGMLPLAAHAGGPGSFRDLTGDRTAALVARQEIEYRAPLLHRTEPVWVDIWVTRVGSSSLSYGFCVADEDRGTVYAYAEAAMVQVDAASGRPTPLTDGQRLVLQHWLGEPVPFRAAAAAAAGKVN